MAATYPTCVPVLTDAVVTLRAHREQDAGRIVEQARDPESVRWTVVPTPYAEADARWFLDHIREQWDAVDGSRSWAITDATDPEGSVLGTVDLRPGGAGRAELGFGLHPAGRGRHLMTAAVRLVCRWWFERGGARVGWAANVGNIGSRRVAWACGFTMEGTRPQALVQRGELRDGWFASLGADEPMTPRTRWFDPPLLEDGTVRLRAWRGDDVDHLVDPDDAALRFMPRGAAPFVGDFDSWRTAREERMSVGEGIYWCLADAASDRPLGHVQVFRLDQPAFAGSGELGYWLLPAARGLGIMGRAVDQARRFAFAAPAEGGLGLHRLAAGTDADNAASNRVLRRAGFRPIAREHEIMAHPGEPHSDGLLWELLRDGPARSAPVIEGRRVRLRGWRLGDSARVVEGCCDPVTAQWLGALPRPYGPNDALEFLSNALATTARGTTVHWALADPGADEVIGAVTLMHLDLVDGSAELGYWTHPDARGRGVMKEAAWWAVRHALLDPEEGGLGLRLVRLRAAATNVASCRVAERVGFRRTGVEPAAHRLGDGSFVDQLRYQVRAEELAATLP